MCPLSGLWMLREHILDTIAQNFCRTAVFRHRENTFFGNAIQYFAGQRYTLTKLQNARNFQLFSHRALTTARKSTKLRAHTVNLAFKLRSFVG